jgi:hypothetical protein
MNGQPRVTILTGAGLCKDAGLPTSAELATNLQEALVSSLNSNTSTPGDRERTKLHLATYRFLNGGIRFQLGILDRDPNQLINIEQIAVAAMELQNRAFNPLSPYTSGWHERLVEIERQAPDILSSFTNFIYSQLESWLGLDDERIQKLHYIRNLVEICNDGCGVDIFSLNYDLCIETALQRYAKREFTNGFTEQGWEPEVFDNEAPVRLYKLHGSLDWIDDQAYGLCSLQYPRNKWAENIEGEGTKPLLIFGTAHKLTPREPFLSLAYAFSQSVLKTTVLAIIGYSFGDEYVNQIVRQGIERNPKLRVLVVSPDATSQIKQTSFLQGRKPRVEDIEAYANRALSDGLFLTRIRDLLQRASNEEPFSEQT